MRSLKLERYRVGVSISIVILNYNSSKYTMDCIDSILSSSYQNYEIIVVDNNSNADERMSIIHI
ncbi:glycosyltransferase family 2 protein [Aeromonas media]